MNTGLVTVISSNVISTAIFIFLLYNQQVEDGTPLQYTAIFFGVTLINAVTVSGILWLIGVTR